MSPCISKRSIALVLFLLLPPLSARADEDARTAASFIQGLRDRGYYDLATEYLAQIVKQADAPPELLSTADYEFGRMLLDEASKSGDLARRKDLLDQARVKLDAFTKSSPKHPKAPEALVDLARLLVELKPDGGLFVTGWSATAADAWDFAAELRKVPGVVRVAVDPQLVK